MVKAVAVTFPIRTSERFHASNADVVFQSVDSVQFRIHKANLNACTEGFSPPEHATFQEIVRLTESSIILELLFQFIYPTSQPNLQSLDFSTIERLAEAAEKYQVFPAMSRCRQFMSDTLPEHAFSIFAYASKHDYPEILAIAAPLILDVPLDNIVSKISPKDIQPWLRYYDRWASVSRRAISVLQPESIQASVALPIVNKLGASLQSLRNLDMAFGTNVGVEVPQPQPVACFTFGTGSVNRPSSSFFDPGDQIKIWRKSIETEVDSIGTFSRQIFSTPSFKPFSCSYHIVPVSLPVTLPKPEVTLNFPYGQGSDGDLALQSSDGHTFRIHRAHLYACATPGAELSSSIISPCVLEESAATLDLLFQYIYPVRKPDLATFSTCVLDLLAHAAEKYKIYSAMAECNIDMRKRLVGSPDAVIAYAINHRYYDMADKAAAAIIYHPLAAVVQRLPKQAILPWLSYHDEWIQITSRATARFLDLKCNEDFFDRAIRKCLGCRTPLDHETIRVMHKLTEGIQALKNIDRIIEIAEVCCDARKGVLNWWRDTVIQDIAGIPSFSTFL